MDSGPHIGIVDSGYAPAQAPLVVAARRFWLTDEDVAEGEPIGDALGHGSAVLQAIAARAPSARFSVAQVFDHRGITSPLQIAAALHWLRGRGCAFGQSEPGGAPGPADPASSLRRAAVRRGIDLRFQPGAWRAGIPLALPGRGSRYRRCTLRGTRMELAA